MPYIYRLPDSPSSLTIPLFSTAVSAGFPSPAADYIEDTLDINALLVVDPPATFMVRVKGDSIGDSMVNAGIAPGDILVVDKGIAPQHGHIVVAIVDGEFTVKRLHAKQGRVALIAENPSYSPIELVEGQELVVWGVVRGCVKQFL